MERTIKDLQMLQALPLKDKIEMTKERIRAWVERYGLDNVAVSFSGGKDSTVLLDIARQMYPDMKAIHVNTGLEFPELEEFVKTFNNITIVKPKMNFVEVIRKYGYPMISKEVAETVQGARKYMRSILTSERASETILTDRQTDRQTELPLLVRQNYGSRKLPFTHQFNRLLGNEGEVQLRVQQTLWKREICKSCNRECPERVQNIIGCRRTGALHDTGKDGNVSGCLRKGLDKKEEGDYP